MAQPLALGFLRVVYVCGVCVCVVVQFGGAYSCGLWELLHESRYIHMYSAVSYPLTPTTAIPHRGLLSLECGVSFLLTSTTPPSPAGEKPCRSFSSYPEIS